MLVGSPNKGVGQILPLLLSGFIRSISRLNYIIISAMLVMKALVSSSLRQRPSWLDLPFTWVQLKFPPDCQAEICSGPSSFTQPVISTLESGGAVVGGGGANPSMYSLRMLSKSAQSMQISISPWEGSTVSRDFLPSRYLELTKTSQKIIRVRTLTFPGTFCKS